METKEIIQTEDIPRPALSNLLTEPLRVWRDLWRLRRFKQAYSIEPSGDGHPVLVVPGLLGNDTSTWELRKFVRKLGYNPYGWELGVNLGNLKEVEKLLNKIEALKEKHDSKVSLIGWSLGGVYAREIAKRRPELIRQIITLAAPFADLEQSNYATWFYKLINYGRPFTEEEKAWIENITDPAPVPTTALYSKQDGIVHWRACMEQMPDDWHQNIEIVGSHLGMPYIPASWVVIEDRLRLQQKDWKPFKVKKELSSLVEFPSL